MFRTLDRCLDAKPATEYVVRICTVRGYRYIPAANRDTAVTIANWHRHAAVLTPNWARALWSVTRLPGLIARPKCPVPLTA